ncbi:MAG: UPF0175 family protein [Pirellulaceae bacterium]
MSLMIPDDNLDGQIEIACRLFAAAKLSKSAATHWLGMTRTKFEEELLKRNLPLTVYTEAQLRQDLEFLGRSR